MHETQPLPPVRAQAPPINVARIKLWSAAGGFAVGALLAGGILGVLLWEQHRRHQAELISYGVTAATPTAVIDAARGFFGGGSTASAKNDTPPTKEEIASYLEGKTLPLPDSGEVSFMPGGKSSKSCLMKKDGLEAVQKGSSFQYGNEPSSTPLTFLYNSGDGRFAVEATIMHKPVGEKTAFFGFTLTRVAQQ